jgi:cytochrome P450
VERLSPEVQALLRRDGLDPLPEVLDGPVVRRARLPLGVRGWVVTGYDEVRSVLGDPQAFSNDFGHVLGRPGIGQELDPGGLGVTDPPHHTELRRLLAPELGAGRLRALLPRLTVVVEEQLTVLERAADREGRADLLRHFARPVPWRVICELLGIDEADRADLLGLVGTRFDLSGGVVGPLSEVTGWAEHLRGLVERARSAPEPGMIARLAAGSDLDDTQLAGVVDGLIVGGLETTASSLALGAFMRLEQPDVSVEDVLRRASVVQVAFPRFARTETRVGPVTVRPDDVVICSLSAANRSLGDRPSPHLAFGHGIHRCVGAALARLELETALPALARRFPRMRSAVPVDQLDFHHQAVVFGVSELPVLLGG